MLTKATVVGTGAMGTIVSEILARNQIHVALLARRPELADELLQCRENRRYLPGMRLSQRITPTCDARAAFANAELIFSAVPCQHLRDTWRRLTPFVPDHVPVCSATKGIDADALLTPSGILVRHLTTRPLAVLSGPSIAPELARRLPTTVVVACDDLDVAAQIQAALSTEWFRVYTNDDVIGVELGGALKNVIALAAGILDGLNAGDNAKAALLTRGLVEISRLGVAMGARPETFAGLAGMGDLVTTCVSPLGRNRSAGERIGRGDRPEDVMATSAGVIEGIPTARAVRQLAQKFGVNMPITQAVNEVLFEGKPPLLAITELMKRPSKPE